MERFIALILMNLRHIFLSRLFFFLLIFEISSQTKNKFLEPCFEEDEILGKCASSDDSCDNIAKTDEFKLFRLPGIGVSEIFAVTSIYYVKNGLSQA